MEILNNLPMEIIEKIKGILKAYDKCNVVYEDGKYEVRTGVCLQANYSQDFRVIGEIKASDIYTPKEMILNYIEEFKSFPYNYKVEKNSYSTLRKYENGEITIKELALELNIIEEAEEDQTCSSCGADLEVVYSPTVYYVDGTKENMQDILYIDELEEYKKAVFNNFGSVVESIEFGEFCSCCLSCL